MDFLSLPFLAEYLRCVDSLYRNGWAERNGGNISMLLHPLPQALPVLRTFPLSFSPSALVGRCIVITGSGSYLKNVSRDPARNLGVLRIGERHVDLLWGLEDGGRPSSELAAHLMSHDACVQRNPAHRVVMHTHATELIAMTRVHTLDERAFSRTLWRMCTECLMFLPEGVAVLPWMPCGTDEIGAKTAEKLRDRRLVVWAHHGAFATGGTPDEALGLLEIANKAAGIYLATAHLPIVQEISDEQLRELAEVLHLPVREGYL